MHKVNIERIQIETLKVISEIENILNDMEVEELDSSKKRVFNKDNILEYQNILRNERKKIDNLEYVIAVVGTMKAGKSTTINAIVGQEILPHRNDPMTSLPTLVSHKQGQITPQLSIPKVEPFNQLLNDIKLKLSDNKNVKGQFLASKDGKIFQEQILNNEIIIEDNYYGQDKIFTFLKTMNDLMRSAKDLNIQAPYEEFVDIDELPRIEVEFFSLKNNETLMQSRLSLLDTPGPDEFKHSLDLKNIFAQQLQRASSVMLIMNYTTMNNESGVSVRQDFEEIIDSIGQEHTYIMANKFDEKKRSDPDYRETQDYIANELLESKISTQHIFPISGKLAFYVNLGLSEIDKKSQLNPNIPWVQDFGEEIIGRKWQREIENIENVKDFCNDAWQESYFEKPLNFVINDSYNSVATKSLNSTLNYLQNKFIMMMSNTWNIQLTSFSKSIEQLQEDIQKITEDIKKMDTIAQSLPKEIEKSLNEVKTKINVSSKKKLKEAKKESLNIVKLAQEQVKNEEIPSEINSNFRKNIWQFLNKDFFENRDKKKQYDELLNEGKVQFDRENGAHEFINTVENVLKNSIKYQLQDVEEAINQELIAFMPKINQKIENELGELLESIKKRMGKNLDIQLPKIVFDKDGFHIKNLLKESITTSSKKVKKDYFGSSFMRAIDFFDNDWGYDEKDIYIIKQKDIISNIESTFDKLSEHIADDVENIYAKQIQTLIDDSLHTIIHEIEAYHGEMENIEKIKIQKNQNDIDIKIKKAKYHQEETDKIKDRINRSKELLGDME